MADHGMQGHFTAMGNAISSLDGMMVSTLNDMAGAFGDDDATMAVVSELAARYQCLLAVASESFALGAYCQERVGANGVCTDGLADFIGERVKAIVMAANMLMSFRISSGCYADYREMFDKAVSDEIDGTASKQAESMLEYIRGLSRADATDDDDAISMLMDYRREKGGE